MHGEWSDDDLQHEASEGRWVADNVNAVPKTTVGTLVPVGFDAYARILFPRVGRGSGQLVVISRLLAEHTGTPHDCWFALWEVPGIEARRAHAERVVTADNDHLNS